jgi:hypothetical protein
MGPAAAPAPARAPVDEGPPPVTVTAPRIAPQIRRDVEVQGDREYERLPGGGLRYTDPQRRFVAIIGVDGKVTFHDAPAVRFDRPGHKMAAAGDGLIESLLRPSGQHDRPEREDPSTELSEEDQQRRDRAIRTQRRIERLMRTLAPEDSRHAYTSTELQRLNESRRSTRRFDPYPAPPGPVQAAPNAPTSPLGDRIVWAG